MTTDPHDLLTARTTEELRRRRSVKWREFPPDVLPMRIAEMDTPLAEPVAEALIAAVGRGDTGYAMAGTLPEAFAGFAARQYGWHPDATAARLVPDVMTGIVEILRIISEPGDRVVVNTPGYPPFFYWIERIGRQVVPSPLAAGPDGHRLDLDRLERDFAAGARAYLLCNPHNPTGLVLTREELEQVAALADRHDVRVVTDEILAPLTYPGHRHIPFPSLDSPAAARSVALVSASKAWNIAGLKAALAVPGAQARADVAAIHEEVSEGAGLFGVLASEAAFTHGGPWLGQLVTALDGNRRLLAARLAEDLPGVGHHPPQAGYVAWLDCRALGWGDDPARVFLRHGGIGLSSGPRFGADGRGFVRLNFATAPERVSEAVRRMAAAREQAGAGA
ncbi:MalY/PatB family protein [Nonomuraea roseoviolacea]|uniref:cysteine-S-conjugate beta-lyase n=1 Tax=Nonomuraea roseoviolacea subsp. carminata TaxID=160689 RepID=A0ABT1KEY4_9ACTN|nr:aminotransferase class I/II-fold pyridoxal phosphate-dependent enzyme [Nonomuraea roseoviolacea]MCP2351921.1 cystathionine beta-lyase [Nonomuraea roseoviolacea subsp. carminata]